MDIITGHTGTAHIQSGDDAALNSAIFGNGNCILEYGNKFAETHNTSTHTITINSGDLLIGGRHARIREGDTETFEFSAVGSGSTRRDAVFACYKKTSGGIESAYLEYVEGSANVYPSTPTIDTSAADFQYYILYRIDIGYHNMQMTYSAVINPDLVAVGSFSCSVVPVYPSSGTSVGRLSGNHFKLGNGTLYSASGVLNVSLNANTYYVFTFKDPTLPSNACGSVSICARAATTDAGVYGCYQTIASVSATANGGVGLVGIHTGNEAVSQIEVNVLLFVAD